MNHRIMLATLSLLPYATASPSPHTNFVIMLADDMGWGDWSRTGAPARTPHLEAMSRADHGVWFQRAYSGNPICSPTRASLHTGRTPARTCIYSVEQHILCHADSGTGRGSCSGGEYSLGNATRTAKAKKGGPNYRSAFYGKWHLGSLSDRGVGSPDCYKKPANETSCQLGYWTMASDATACCFGTDGHLPVSHPLDFGYDEFVATPECAASATTNCGCFFFPTPHNDTPCELGHYHTRSGASPYNECMQYYVGNRSILKAHTEEEEEEMEATATATTTTTTTMTRKTKTKTKSSSLSIEPITYVSSIDDEEFLVDQFIEMATRSIAESRPFLAVICFQ